MAKKVKEPLLEVGQKVWVFDEYRRKYHPPTAAEKKRGAIGGQGPPIWREHWVEGTIARETRVAWYAKASWKEVKIPKKVVREQGIDVIHGVIFSEEQLNRRVWVRKHRNQILRQMEGLGYREELSYESWKAIAKIVGYDG